MTSTPEPIAIVGMACAFPGAPDLEAFWRLISCGTDALRDAPPERLIPEDFGLKTKRGGFLNELVFDPLPFGIMPAALDDGDAEQFLLLGTVHSALKDAGIESLRDQAERAEIVVGRGGYMNDAGEVLFMSGEGVAQIMELLRGIAPDLPPEKLEELRNNLLHSLPQLSPDTIASTIPNLVAGRVANRLDCMGLSYTIDAACASSLLAIERVVSDLRSTKCDIGIAAGIHIMQKPYFWRAFEMLGGISSREKYAPYDADSNGLMMGEGVGAVILKRLSQAQADGDRIYATVLGVGVSSDGRGQGLMAPRREGQVLALRHAYEESGVDPRSIQLVEGHGTGTKAGDSIEIETLREVFGESSGTTDKENFGEVVLGSIKSQIGHAMPAAGIAGIIKTALALHHKVLPPTINVVKPHPKLQGSRFFLNNTLRPWLPIEIDRKAQPRRAGVNAFGFGGINAHAVLQEKSLLSEDVAEISPQFTPREWELFVVAQSSREALIHRLQQWHKTLEQCYRAPQEDESATSQNSEMRDATAHNVARDRLRDAAWAAWQETKNQTEVGARIAFVAKDLEDLSAQLIRAVGVLESDAPTSEESFYFREGELDGELVVLFPGIGFPGLAGGYTKRLAELCTHFPIVRRRIEQADAACQDDGNFPYPLRHQLFPPSFLSRDELGRIERELAWSPRTLPGMMAANIATWELLRLLKIEPDALAGFSLGEWSALAASGTVDGDELQHFLEYIAEADDKNLGFSRVEEAGSWAMIAASPEDVEVELAKIDGIINITIDTAPHQVFIGGQTTAVAEAVRIFKAKKVWAQQLPFPAVHTPLAAPAVARLMEKKENLSVHKSNYTLYTGAGGTIYPDDPDEILNCLFGGIVEPVRARQTVKRLYEDGMRIFVQVGSGGKMLANLRHCFGDQPYVAAALDLDHRGGLEQFLHCAGQLFSCGVPMNLDALFAGRGCRDFETDGGLRVSTTTRVLSLTPPRLHASESTLQAMRAALIPESTNGQENSVQEKRPATQLPKPNTAGASTLVAQTAATMQQFLETQRQHEDSENQLLGQYLQMSASMMAQIGNGAPVGNGAPAALSTPPPAAVPFPLLGEIIEHQPGQRLRTRLLLDLDTMPLLRDHSLLRLPADLMPLKPLEERMPTLPMTGSLEVLAEAASTLAPGWEVSKLCDIEARRWIALEDVRQKAFLISATCIRADENEVEVAVEIADEKEDGTAEEFALRGRVILTRELAAAPAARAVQLDRPCPRNVHDFYAGPLFHGPAFRVLREFTKMSDDAVEAILDVPDPQNLFDEPLQANPIFDAALLDGLGQALAYPVVLDKWSVFPSKLGALERFAPTPPVGSKVRCVVTYRRLDARRMQGDVEVFDENDTMWLRITDWLDWRLLWPADFLGFDFHPRRAFVAEAYQFSDQESDQENNQENDQENDKYSCRSLHRSALGGIDADWFARYYLRPDEWKQYQASPRFDWLLGRIAAKDAVRDFLFRAEKKEFHPLEIEISNNDSGQPIVILPEVEINLSISHLNDEAIAVAGNGLLGIDLARQEKREPEWKELAFNAAEMGVLTACGDAEEWALRGWCAKEAAAKSQGLGLESVGSFRIVSADGDNENIGVELAPYNTIFEVTTRFHKKRARALVAVASPQ